MLGGCHPLNLTYIHLYIYLRTSPPSPWPLFADVGSAVWCDGLCLLPGGQVSRVGQQAHGAVWGTAGPQPGLAATLLPAQEAWGGSGGQCR